MKLAEQGINPDHPDVIGFHGTSAEAIRHLAEHGRMPIGGLLEDRFFISPKDRTTGWCEGYTPQNDAKKYGLINAVRSKLISDITQQRELTREEIMRIFMGFESTDMLVNPLGKEDDVAQAFVMNALGIPRHADYKKYIEMIQRERKGILLTLGKSILKNPSVVTMHDGDYVITDPRGISIEHIHGIEPLGDYEWKELMEKRLKNIQQHPFR